MGKTRKPSRKKKKKKAGLRPSLADVARAAGVSKTTVSLVLNQKSKEIAISEATRQRVLEMARKVNYRPPVPRLYASQVRGLVRHISLAFINPSGRDYHEFLAPAFYEIARAAGEAGLLIHTNEGVRTNDVKAYGQALRERDTDGLILFTFYNEPGGWWDLVRAFEIPCVLFNRDFGDDFPCVVMDHEGQAADQVARLLSAGHRRIAGLGQFQCTSALRLNGYRKRLRQAGRYDPLLERETPYHAETAQAVGARLLEEAPEVTAVFCSTDLVALGMLRAAKAKGRSVPGDLSIASMDGYAFSAYTEPPLSTVRYPRPEMGRAALKLLRKVALHRVASPARVTVRGEVLKGGTIASPRPGSVRSERGVRRPG